MSQGLAGFPPRQWLSSLYSMDGWILTPFVSFSPSDQQTTGLNQAEHRQQQDKPLWAFAATNQQGKFFQIPEATSRRPRAGLEPTKPPPPQTSPNFNLLRRRWWTDRGPAGDRRQLLPPRPLAAMAGLKRHHDGKIAGLYDLDKTLGRGHFAVVKLARHVFTGEKVCVSLTYHASAML